jgi:D-arabinitol dehydrogenase (NADP+)
MFGAGPTGLVLTQMLRQNGGCHVVVAAPQGLKMDLAKSLDAADVYVELSRSNPGPQFEQLKKENPYGFDIVVEATGSVKILEDAINYVRRGGKLVVYGVYGNKDRVSWPPSKICKFLLSPSLLPRRPSHLQLRLNNRPHQTRANKHVKKQSATKSPS